MCVCVCVCESWSRPWCWEVPLKSIIVRARATEGDRAWPRWATTCQLGADEAIEHHKTRQRRCHCQSLQPAKAC